MWWTRTVHLCLSFLTDSPLVLYSERVLVTTGSMRLYLQPNQVAHAQEHGGDTRKPTERQGELDTAVEGHQPSSRTGICSFVRGGTGGALPEPYKMTSRLFNLSGARVFKEFVGYIGG